MLPLGVLLALDFWLLTVRPFWLATALVAINNALIVFMWNRNPGRGASVQRPGRRWMFTASIAAAAIALVAVAAYAWLQQILMYPNDPQRADMLTVIQLGIRRLLQGRNPYAMYQVPWPATLPYGPVMWAPMIVPYVLHADVRFATVAAALCVPAACAFTAIAAMRRGERASAVGILILLAGIVFSPDLRRFMSIGHTPAYWPLLPLFAWLAVRERWVPAAVACGLLIVARTTMIAIVPVLLIAVWYRSRRQIGAVMLSLGAAVALPLLPFAIANPHSFAYAFYGSYQDVIKGFVWTSTTWTQNTIGITGLLLAHHWQSWVEAVQILAMALTTAGAYFAIRSGGPIVPWMAMSLLVFSMTTLWPVIYVYFDVFLLLASAAVVERWPADRARGARVWLVSVAGGVLTLALVSIAVVPVHAAVDVGSTEARMQLYDGFSGDERAGDRTYAWMIGTSAKVLIPVLFRNDTNIVITCQPYLATRGTRQTLGVALNGTLLGTVELQDGWQRVSFRAPARAWQRGVNELGLFAAAATSPKDVGESADPRRLSIAVDRIDVATW